MLSHASRATRQPPDKTQSVDKLAGHLLASGDAELVQPVRRLQQDHGWLEEDWFELAPQLRAVAEGQNGYDPDFLRAATQTFTEFYREHIALEESVVYPASRRRQRG